VDKKDCLSPRQDAIKQVPRAEGRRFESGPNTFLSAKAKPEERTKSQSNLWSSAPNPFGYGDRQACHIHGVCTGKFGWGSHNYSKISACCVSMQSFSDTVCNIMSGASGRVMCWSRVLDAIACSVFETVPF